jgi:cell division protein FtsI/penicillin-binding protein 2
MDWSQFQSTRHGDQRMNRRILWAGFALCIGFTGICSRLWWLQKVQSPSLSGQALSMRLDEKPLPALRGSIYDRDGELLAQDRTLHEVYADKEHLYDHRVIQNALAMTLGMTKAKLVSMMSPEDMTAAYVSHLTPILAAHMGVESNDLHKVLQPGGISAPLLGKKLEKEEAQAWQELIRSRNLKGIHLRSYAKRLYPAGDRVKNLLGVVNAEKKGVDGMEQMMNARLEGLDGHETVEKDALRQRVLPGGFTERTEPKHGEHLVLSFDMSLQHYLEDVMLRVHQQHRTQKVQAILLEPSTGSILAMAGHPKVHRVREKSGIEVDDPRNIVITDIFEPGSTMKIVTVAAGMQAGVIHSGSTIFCNNGLYEEAENKVTLRDHVSLGYASIAKILSESSNIGAYKIAKKMGATRFYEAITGFGFGSRSGIGLPRESSGIVRPLERWSGTTLSRMAMGYEISVTPLQMIMAVGAIANKGTLLKPRLVESIISPDGRTITPEPIVPVKQVCSPRVATAVTTMLEEVVNDGTGGGAAIPGVRVAGKTGTARWYDPTYTGPDGSKYRPGHYIVSFAGFAPADNPKLACLIVLHLPKSDDPKMLYGGKLAAPIFAEVMKEALTHLDTKPQRPLRLTLAGEGGGE